jgi:hypothetical protein
LKRAIVLRSNSMPSLFPPSDTCSESSRFND